MENLRRELMRLNDNLERLTNFLAPAIDRKIFIKYKALRVFSSSRGFGVRGIENPDPVRFRELKGISHVLEELRGNTERFLQGLPCNNVLVYGTRGTGKSSAVKGVFNEYARKGLRMIEMPKETLPFILEVAELVRSRSEKFVVFCDDLSFEEEDTSYRQIKTLLEGGIEMRPGNMLIYATSNRRHLIPEKSSDNLPVSSEGELHPSDTLEEKLSLSDRFGLRLGVHSFDLQTYLSIVFNYAKLRDIKMDDRRITERAVQWSLAHGSYSGRTARQFVDDLEGRLKQKKRK